jgi:hypothetical protein
MCVILALDLVTVGNPTGTDNVSIDAELVRAYGGDFN